MSLALTVGAACSSQDADTDRTEAPDDDVASSDGDGTAATGTAAGTEPSGPQQTEARVAPDTLTGTERLDKLAEVLLRGDDFAGDELVALSDGDAPFPMTAESAAGDYQPAPDQFCPDGATVPPIGVDDVFFVMDGHDAWVFSSQWVSGEPSDAAAERFTATADAFRACVDASPQGTGDEQADWALAERPDPGTDEAVVLTISHAGEAVVEVLYARTGGVLMMLLLDGPSDEEGFTGWAPGEKDVVLDTALDKVASAEYTEWPPAEPPADPSIPLADAGTPTEIAIDGVTCAEPPTPAPVELADVTLPEPAPAAIRWQVSGDDAFDDDVVPNDAADAGVAYGVDQSLQLLSTDGDLIWAWDADVQHDVDIATHVYALADDEGDAGLVALAADAGEPLWASRLPGDDDSWSGVEAVGGTVYARGRHAQQGATSTSYEPVTAAYDAATGQARWRAPADFLAGSGGIALLDAGPESAGDDAALCAVVALDAVSGTLLWAAVPAPRVDVEVGVAVSDDVVFVAWRPNSYQTAGDDFVTVQAIDAVTGAALWTQTMPRDASLPTGRIWLAADTGAVYVEANAGQDYFNADQTSVAAFGRGDGRPLWASQLPEGGAGRVEYGLQVRDSELLIPVQNSVVHLSTVDGTATAVESVPFEWAGELIVTTDGPVLLGRSALALID